MSELEVPVKTETIAKELLHASVYLYSYVEQLEYLLSTQSPYITDNPTELEMHRMDYNAIKSAGFESPGELLAAYHHLLSNRITEYESFEVILSFYWFMENFKQKNNRNPSLVEWYEAEGRNVLDKINGDKG